MSSTTVICDEKYTRSKIESPIHSTLSWTLSDFDTSKMRLNSDPAVELKTLPPSISDQCQLPRFDTSPPHIIFIRHEPVISALKCVKALVRNTTPNLHLLSRLRVQPVLTPAAVSFEVSINPRRALVAQSTRYNTYPLLRGDRKSG